MLKYRHYFYCSRRFCVLSHLKPVLTRQVILLLRAIKIIQLIFLDNHFPAGDSPFNFRKNKTALTDSTAEVYLPKEGARGLPKPIRAFFLNSFLFTDTKNPLS